MVIVGQIVPRASQTYRKKLADMFVAGRIKQIATKQGINLMDELKEFATARRINQVSEQDLDITISKDLQEEIVKPIKEKKEKK